MAAWTEKNEGKKKKSKKPPFVLSNFLTFIRTPMCTSFRILGMDGADPYELLAVNAHLLYGHQSKQKHERALEFHALLQWLIERAKNVSKLYHKNLILLGDLNLDFRKVDSRRDEIEKEIKSLNTTKLKSKKTATVNSPFIPVHPDRDEVFRSTARQTETYDRIAFFNHDPRLPDPEANKTAGTQPDGFDYGVFNFTDLFAQALHGKSFSELTKTQKKALLPKYEHDVSDHLPIWVRLPRPRIS
jgi:exonuclease III